MSEFKTLPGALTSEQVQELQNRINGKKTPIEQFADEIQRIKDSESYQNCELNNAPSKSVQVPLRMDPVILLDQIQQMRKEGVDEATIKAAFYEAMEQAQGEPRKVRNSMKAHRDAPKMPSQEEMNSVYVNRYAHGIDDTSIRNESVSAVVDAINAAQARKQMAPPKPPFRTRVAYFIARKVLATLIVFCKVLGVK